MQTVTTSHGDKLFVPDAKELGGKIASVDTTGWVSFGWVGSGDAYIIDKDEWSSFVAFVNEIDAVIRPNTQVQAGPAGFMAGIAPGTDRLERLTHEDLRRWGAALDKEMPRGIGERLLRFADDWRKSIEIEREECARVCDRMLDPDYVRDADECAAAIRVRLDCGNTNNA